MDKQIILFVVEGKSEQVSFENILNQLVTNDKIKFLLIQGDVTVKSNKYTVVKKLSNNIINFFQLPKNKHLKISDIKKIVHLVDLDGVFINPSKIIKNDKNIKEYNKNNYSVPNVEEIIKRNENKSSVLKKLLTTNYLNINEKSIPYEIYYFSCNLEHVLHNNPNVNDINEKIAFSDEFSAQYLGYEKYFIDFINDTSFAFNGNYVDSWNEAIKEENALKRMTNFNLFFEKDD